MRLFCLDRQYILRKIILLTILPTGIGSKFAHLQFRDSFERKPNLALTQEVLHVLRSKCAEVRTKCQ